MIHIFLADDHEVVRNGLRFVLAKQKDFSICGEASDGLQVVEMVEKAKPDVLILDLMMPGLNGMDITYQLSQRMPDVRIIILSMHANEAYVTEALKNGAMGYVLKDSHSEELIEAVRAVMQGRRYFSPSISERVIESYIRKIRLSSEDPYDTLTSREREVLHLLAEGLNHPEIAERLSISPRTVENHHNNLAVKLNLHSQAELIRYAIKRGLISLE